MPDLLPFSDPDYIADPYASWERLRDESPVHWYEEGRFWAITRYEDVLAILHDPERFSSTGGPMGRSEEAGLPRMPLIQDDPPAHDRLRRILSRAFTPKITGEREEQIRGIAQSLMDGLRARLSAVEACDLVQAFSGPFPVSVIAEILGIPPEMHDRLKLWNATTSVVGAAELRDAHAPTVMQEMYDTLAQLVEERRQRRRNDLFSALIDGSEDEESPLQPHELVGLCQLLWTAGNETTTNLLSNSALVLQESPDLLEMVRQQPERIPAVIEELLRLHSPVNCLARTAAEDVSLHGQEIRRGDVLMILFAAANRDPRHFDRPDEFDPDRKPNDHVAFSHGIHFCLGSHLARLEARVGLELLGELLPDVRLLPEAGLRLPVGMLRGWLRLPVEPRSGAR